MKRYLVYIFFLLSPFVKAQINLVPNPSFEQLDTCPYTASLLNYASPWFQPTVGTPDCFNSCWDTLSNTITNVSLPYNYFGYQNARTGVGCAGLFTFYYNSQTYREYIEVKLSDSLTANQKYYLTFYFVLADSSNYATDELGAYFSNDSILRTDYDAFGLTPSIENQQGNFLTDRINWTKFYGEYIAIGGEKFLTIGNFKNDANTDTMYFPSGGTTGNGAYTSSYLLIDDVCVSSDSVTCSLTGFNEYSNYETISVLPNPGDDVLIINSKNSPIDEAKLFNVVGEKVFEKKANDNSIRINLMQFKSGFYFLQLRINQTYISKKILIKH